ncbi:MAG: tetratricopeptide repeat protein [Mariprofundales bacterium]|nr:tetratricopeptide repeat protein [Mariprofundales bacterium]
MTAELDDLKRDMRSAQLVEWIVTNKQTLAAVVAVVVIALLASSLWVARSKAQREAAATIYYQATAVSDPLKRKALLETVVHDYSRTGYAPLSLFQLVSLDSDKAPEYLKELLDSSAPRELKWQARLDLAEHLIASGNQAKAEAYLKADVGQEYAQLRWYLRAQIATDDAGRREALQKALDASSNDADLKKRIQRTLAALSVAG